MLKLLSTAALAAVAFADEPVGTVIGIDLGTTYSVRDAARTPRPASPPASR
jgi:molecular chaperone DnaK (HSP70)